MANDDMTMNGQLGWNSGQSQYQSNLAQMLAMQQASAQAYYAAQQMNTQSARPTDDPLLVLLTEE